MMRFVNPTLRADIEFMVRLVDIPNAIKYASAELKGDKAIVMKATRAWHGALRWASADLQNDPDLIKMIRFSQLPRCCHI